jgi:hypothetical protein
VEDNEEFDYTLYFDAATAEFFFAGGLGDHRKKTPEPFLIRVRDVLGWNFTFYRSSSASR